MLWLDVTPSFCNNHNRKYDPSKQRYPMNIINKREKWFFILSYNFSKLSEKKVKFSIRIKQVFRKIFPRLPKTIKHFQNLKRSKIFSGLKWCLCQNLFLFLFLDLISSFYCKTRGAVTLTKNPIVLHCIVLTKLIVCKLIRYCVPSALNGLKSFFNIKKWE